MPNNLFKHKTQRISRTSDTLYILKYYSLKYHNPASYRSFEESHSNSFIPRSPNSFFIIGVWMIRPTRLSHIIGRTVQKYVLKFSLQPNSINVYWADSRVKIWRFFDVSGNNSVHIFRVCWWLGGTKTHHHHHHHNNNRFWLYPTTSTPRRWARRYFPKRRQTKSWRGCLPGKILFFKSSSRNTVL